MSGNKPLLPQYAFMAWTDTTVLLPLSLLNTNVLPQLNEQPQNNITHVASHTQTQVYAL
jgi:hypothetical protein